MDSTSGKTDKPKLEELSREQLIHLLNEAMDRLKNANERIETLEKELTDTLPPKLPVPYSVRSAEAHQVYSLGLSFDKAIALQKFFQNLDLKKLLPWCSTQHLTKEL